MKKNTVEANKAAVTNQKLTPVISDASRSPPPAANVGIATNPTSIRKIFFIITLPLIIIDLEIYHKCIFFSK